MKNLFITAACGFLFLVNPAYGFEDKQKECRDFDYSCLQKNRSYDFEREIHTEDNVKNTTPAKNEDFSPDWKRPKKSKSESLGDIQSDQLKKR